MLNDDQLGEILREDLHAIGAGIEPRSEWWDRLIPTPAERHQHRRARWLVPAVAAAAAIVAILLFAFSGPRTQPAFAVTVRANSVTITLSQVSAVSGLNRELETLKLPFRAVRVTAACPTRLNLSYIGQGERPASIHLLRNRLPKDITVILAAHQTGKDRVTFAFGRIKGQPPACVSSHGVGPGLPGFTPTTSSTQAPPSTSENG